MSSNDVRILIQATNEASAVLVQVQADAKAASSEMQSGFDGAAESSGNLVKSLAELAAAMAVFMGVSASIHDVFDEMNALQNASNQTAAVLKSTGDVSGVTAEQVEKLAGALEHQSTYSKATIQAAENMLLTFTNIGGKILPQTTQVVMDMAAAFKASGKAMDISDIAIQVGKALNDPIKGMTALQREGVSFTQAQKDLVKQLVETGRGAEAQQMILAELAKEFGGSAKAATQSFSGELTMLKNEALTGVAEYLNKNLLPHLQDFVSLVQNQIVPAVKDWISNDLTPFLQHLGDILNGTVMPPLRDLASFLQDHADQVKEFGIAFLAVAAAFGVASVAGTALALVFGLLTSPVTILIVAIAALGVAVYEIQQHWEDLTARFPALQQAWNQIQQTIDQFRQWVVGTLLPELQTAWSEIESDVAQLAQDVETHWDEISQIIGVVMSVIHGIISVEWAQIKAVVLGTMTAIQGIIAAVTAAIHGDWSGAWTAIENMAIGIWDDIVGMLHDILGGAEGIVAAIWNNVGSTTADIWRGIVGVVQAGVNAILGLLADMVHAVGAAMGQLASLSTPSITLPSVDTPLGKVGGATIGGITPFAGLSGAAGALQGFNPSVNLQGLAFGFTPIQTGGGTPAPTRHSAVSAPGVPAGTEGTQGVGEELPDMTGEGAGDFNTGPAGGRGHTAKPHKPKAGPAAPSVPGSEAQQQRDLNEAQAAYNHLLDQAQTLTGQVHEKSTTWTQALLDGLHADTEAARTHAQSLNDAAMEAQKQWMAAIGGYDATTKASKTYTQAEIDAAHERYKAAAQASDDATKDFTQDLAAETKAQAAYDAQVKASYAARRSMASDQRQFDKDAAAAQRQMANDSRDVIDQQGQVMLDAAGQATDAWKTANAAVLADEKALTGNLSAEDRQQLEDTLQKDKDIRADAKQTATDQLQATHDYVTQAAQEYDKEVQAAKSANQAILSDRASLFDLQHKLTHQDVYEKQVGLGQWLQAEMDTIHQIDALEQQLADARDERDRKFIQSQIDAAQATLGQQKENAREAETTAQDLANAAKQTATTAKDAVHGIASAIVSSFQPAAAAVQAVVDPLKELLGVFQAPSSEELGLQKQADRLAIQIAQMQEAGTGDTTALAAQKQAIDAKISAYANERKATEDLAQTEGALADNRTSSITQLRDHFGDLVTAETNGAKAAITLTQALADMSGAMHAAAQHVSNASPVGLGAIGMASFTASTSTSGGKGVVGHFAHGGVVPADGWAYVHAGETVLPAGGSGSGGGSTGGGGTALTVVINALDAHSVAAYVPELSRQIDLHLQRGGGKGLTGTGAAAR